MATGASAPASGMAVASTDHAVIAKSRTLQASDSSLHGKAAASRSATAKRERAPQILNASETISDDYPHQDISSGGPLTSIGVGEDLSCQVAFAADTSLEFFGSTEDPGDCGTMISVAGQLYAPDFSQHDYTATGNLGSYIPFTPASQSAVTGSGTVS